VAIVANTGGPHALRLQSTEKELHREPRHPSGSRTPGGRAGRGAGAAGRRPPAAAAIDVDLCRAADRQRARPRRPPLRSGRLLARSLRVGTATAAVPGAQPARSRAVAARARDKNYRARRRVPDGAGAAPATATRVSILAVVPPRARRLR